MDHYFELDLNTIELDAELARQVPYDLCRYYLALPLGCENGRISVAMTYPDNQKARRILERMLCAEVIPLFVPAESLALALERIYGPDKRLSSPLIIQRGDALREHQVIQRILMVLRGFASDARALDWLAPFANQQQAIVTLMPLTNGSGLDLSQYHCQTSPAGQHLERCLRRLHMENVPVNLKFRQGDAVQQVVAEVTGDHYDLLAIAAEADGEFVSQVITAVDQKQVHNGRPIFVLTPPAPPFLGDNTGAAHHDK